jgi:hypothetical protein
MSNIRLTNPVISPGYLSQPAADAVIPPGGDLTVLVNAARR